MLASFMCASVDPERIVDVYFGAANQSGEDNRDVAGWRRCSPGCRRASRARPSTASAPPAWRRSTAPPARSRLGEGDFYLAGGVESMSRAPWVVEKPERGLPAARRRCTTRPSAGG